MLVFDATEDVCRKAADNIQAISPPENIVAMDEAAWECGGCSLRQVEHSMTERNEVAAAISRLAEMIGPGVTGLSFRLELEGGAIALTPEDLPLRVSATPDGRTVFAAQWRDVTIAWEFVPRDGGFCVKLRATAASPLWCDAMQSLIITYEPGGDLSSWRVPTLGMDIDHNGVPTVAEAGGEAVRGRFARGIFRDSRTPGLFVGTIIPQKCIQVYRVSAAGDRARVTCTTEFPEGLAGQMQLISERTWVCATRTAAQAYATHAAFVPPISPTPRPPVGWNSWDYYFSALWLEDIVENMEAIRADPALAEQVRHIVVDMGWEHVWGEWYPNYRFPGGLERLAGEITARGFTPGIWTSPLIVGTLTTTALRRQEILVKDEYGDPQGWGGQYVVDPTHPGGQEYLREVYTRLHAAGFRLFKVDYVTPLLEMKRLHDPTKGHYEALADLARLIRDCVGPESHILGCGLPPECGPGLVESGRTGMDIHNHWTHVTWTFDYATMLYGIHNRIWVNDVDFLVVRGKDTSLEPETNVLNPQAHNPNQSRWRGGPVFSRDEAQSWASIVAMFGGSVFLSDRLDMLTEDAREMLRKVLRPTGVSARPLDLCDGERASLWLQELEGGSRLMVINWAAEERVVEFAFADHDLAAPGEVIDFWTGKTLAVDDGLLRLHLPAHASFVGCWAAGVDITR